MPVVKRANSRRHSHENVACKTSEVSTVNAITCLPSMQPRSPLCPIPEAAWNPSSEGNSTHSEPSTPTAKVDIPQVKSKTLPFQQETPQLANVVPKKVEKRGISPNTKIRQKQDSSNNNKVQLSNPTEVDAPAQSARQCTGTNDIPNSGNADTPYSREVSTNARAASVHSTPRVAKGGKPSYFGENECSTNQHSANNLSVRTVARSLRYVHNSSGCTVSNTAIKNVGIHSMVPRNINFVQSRIAQGFVEACEESPPHFDLQEDPSFWNDHNVQVLIRSRPLRSSEISSQGYSRCIKQESPQSLTWLGSPESRFTFDHVACETTTQEMLFNVAGLPMVENCMSGYNSCMFAYGQTGSGKTHTMLGNMDGLDKCPNDERGMTPRVFEYLFSRIKQEEEARAQEHLKYICKCSFLEIYNEQITDLLEPSSTNLQLREDARKGVYVENLLEVEVGCLQDVLQLLLMGAANRKVAATNMNKESSRSHSVFTCVIESKWEKDSIINARFGRLNLVDLAGSERQKASGAEGERLKEAANINKSLSTLGLVIMILVDVANGRHKHVPYRDSKLTFLLQDSLGGNSKTIIIATISPSTSSALESLSTLKFAQRAKFIRNNAVVNEDASGDVVALRHQIQKLKEELNSQRCQIISRSQTCSLSSPRGTSFVENKLELDSSKKVIELEAVLAGSLRREHVAENMAKRISAQLNRMVDHFESSGQCKDMLLKAQREKIHSMELLMAGLSPEDSLLVEGNKSLMEKLQLASATRSEDTDLIVKNMQLMEQLQRYEDFYENGERESLLEEISQLRNQVVQTLNSQLQFETSKELPISVDSDVSTQEAELLRLEVDNYKKDLDDCRGQLNQCLQSNTELERELYDLRTKAKFLTAKCNDLQEVIALQKSQKDEMETRLHDATKLHLEFQDRLQASEATVFQLKAQLEDAMAMNELSPPAAMLKNSDDGIKVGLAFNEDGESSKVVLKNIHTQTDSFLEEYKMSMERKVTEYQQLCKEIEDVTTSELLKGEEALNDVVIGMGDIKGAFSGSSLYAQEENAKACSREKSLMLLQGYLHHAYIMAKETEDKAKDLNQVAVDLTNMQTGLRRAFQESKVQETEFLTEAGALGDKEMDIDHDHSAVEDGAHLIMDLKNLIMSLQMQLKDAESRVSETEQKYQALLVQSESQKQIWEAENSAVIKMQEDAIEQIKSSHRVVEEDLNLSHSRMVENLDSLQYDNDQLEMALKDASRNVCLLQKEVLEAKQIKEDLCRKLEHQQMAWDAEREAPFAENENNMAQIKSQHRLLEEGLHLKLSKLEERAIILQNENQRLHSNFQEVSERERDFRSQVDELTHAFKVSENDYQHSLVQLEGHLLEVKTELSKKEMDLSVTQTELTRLEALVEDAKDKVKELIKENDKISDELKREKNTLSSSPANVAEQNEVYHEMVGVQNVECSETQVAACETCLEENLSKLGETFSVREVAEIFGEFLSILQEGTAIEVMTDMISDAHKLRDEINGAMASLRLSCAELREDIGLHDERKQCTESVRDTAVELLKLSGSRTNDGKEIKMDDTNVSHCYTYEAAAIKAELSLTQSVVKDLIAAVSEKDICIEALQLEVQQSSQRSQEAEELCLSVLQDLEINSTEVEDVFIKLSKGNMHGQQSKNNGEISLDINSRLIQLLERWLNIREAASKLLDTISEKTFREDENIQGETMDFSVAELHGVINDLKSMNTEETKQEMLEAKLLEASMGELQGVIDGLQRKITNIQEDAERQRLMREELESELQAVKNRTCSHNAVVDMADDNRSIHNYVSELACVRNELEKLSRESDGKDDEIARYRARIMTLLAASEKQAAEYQQTINTLESMLKSKSEQKMPSYMLAERPVSPLGSDSQESPQQIYCNVDEELNMSRKRIEELEALAAFRQKEVFLLNAKLAEAETMTHDVVRDLLGVKLDIKNCVSLFSQERFHRQHGVEEDKELEILRMRLREFVDERESWLDEIKSKQTEMEAARITAERLRMDNEKLKEELNVKGREILTLSEHVKRLSEQQNLQHRIYHHERIKEENSTLRLENEELVSKLKQMGTSLARANEELARYKISGDKDITVDIDEEQRLARKLREVEEDRLHIAERLIDLCASIMQAAGLACPGREGDVFLALEALRKLQDQIQAMEQELSDMRIKVRVAEERQRLGDLRLSCSPSPSPNAGFHRSPSISKNKGASQRFPGSPIPVYQR